MECCSAAVRREARLRALGPLLGSLDSLVNGGTLNFVALYVSSIVESLSFLGPGCSRREVQGRCK